MTSSPRLSYVGLQAALAFYLINLMEFSFDTSLYPARDRLIGIMLGFFAMWLVFDQFWAAPAGVEMKAAFTSGLRLLAQLTREPVSADPREAIGRSYALGETINARFNQVRSLADAVLFEFGPTRRRDLTMRQYIRRWQPQLRSLFLMRITSFKFRLRLPGHELPEIVRAAQQTYDERTATVLDELADRLDGKSTPGSEMAAIGIGAIEQAEESSRAVGEQQEHLDAFMNLFRHIDEVITSLAEQITAASV